MDSGWIPVLQGTQCDLGRHLRLQSQPPRTALEKAQAGSRGLEPRNLSGHWAPRTPERLPGHRGRLVGRRAAARRAARRRGAQGSARATPLRAPPLQLSLAGAASRGRTLVPAVALQLHRLRHFSSASVRSPSAPGVPARLGAAKKRQREVGAGAHRGLPRAGPECSVPAAWPSRASRVGGSSIPRTGAQRPHRRASDPCPAPPSTGRADPSRGRNPGSAQRVSGVLPAASSRRRDFSAEAQGGRQLLLARLLRSPGRFLGGCLSPVLPFGSRSRPACAPLRAHGGRTMLCCLLVRASNLPSVKKDRRSDPVASLSFRGENPVVAASACGHRQTPRAAGRVYAPALALTLDQATVSPCQPGQKSQPCLLPEGRGG